MGFTVLVVNYNALTSFLKRSSGARAALVYMLTPLQLSPVSLFVSRSTHGLKNGLNFL